MPIIIPNIYTQPKQAQKPIGSPAPSLIYGEPINPLWFVLGAGLVLFLLMKDR